jgi:hypothetical protein
MTSRLRHCDRTRSTSSALLTRSTPLDVLMRTGGTDAAVSTALNFAMSGHFCTGFLALAILPVVRSINPYMQSPIRPY